MKTEQSSFIEITAFNGECEVMFHISIPSGEVTDAYVFSRDVGDEWGDFKEEKFNAPGQNSLFRHVNDLSYAKILWQRWKKWVNSDDLKELKQLTNAK